MRKDTSVNRDVIRTHAEVMGESVNAFLLRAVEEAIERDNAKAAKASKDASEVMVSGEGWTCKIEKMTPGVFKTEMTWTDAAEEKPAPKKRRRKINIKV